MWFIIALVVIVFLLPSLFRHQLYRLGYRHRVVSVEINMHNASEFVIGGGLYSALELLRTERNTQVLAITIHDNSLSIAHNQSLRMLLERLQQVGKQIWVYLYAKDRNALYLASIADKIYMFPTGSLFWNGLGGHHGFYKKLLDTVGLKADFERAGSYKSFAEPYTKEEPSEEYKEQYIALFSSLQKQIVASIASSRKREEALFIEALSKSPFTAEQAKELGLIDEITYHDQFLEALESFTKSEIISLSSLAFWINWSRRVRIVGAKKPTIAVLHLRGSIHEQGEEGRSIISDIACSQLAFLKKNSSIQAVVLYVDSPGGSAQASECILREVELLSREKPVVAFFSSVAASGGYYLSVMSGEIVALPTSITGSIGVVGGKVVVEEAAKKVGIHLANISVGPDFDMFSPAVPFSEDQRARFQGFLMHTYQRFLQVVSNGRGMPIEAVEKRAKGRVYTGEQALEEGLVDRLGDLNLAIERAALRANLKRYQVVHFKTKQNWKQKLRSQLKPFSTVELPESIAMLQKHPLEALLYWPESEDVIS